MIDLEPLGSLYHPKCVNDKCKWAFRSKQIMRLEKGQLVTCEISVAQAQALRSRDKGHWFDPCQDVYPRSINLLPFSREPNAEPVDKRRITLSKPWSSNPPDQVLDQNTLPITPESQLASPEAPTVKPVRKRKRGKGGPSRSQSSIVNAIDDTPHLGEDEMNADRYDQDNPYNGTEDFTDGSVLMDHFIISKRHLDWDRARFDSLKNRLEQAEKEADRQEALSQQWAAEAQRVSRLHAREKERSKKYQDEKELELKAANEEVDRQKGLAQEWYDKAQEVLTELNVAAVRIEDLETKGKATVLDKDKLAADKDALEQENATLKAEAEAAKAKVVELEARGRKMFDEAWNSQ